MNKGLKYFCKTSIEGGSARISYHRHREWKEVSRHHEKHECVPWVRSFLFCSLSLPVSLPPFRPQCGWTRVASKCWSFKKPFSQGARQQHKLLGLSTGLSQRPPQSVAPRPQERPGVQEAGALRPLRLPQWCPPDPSKPIAGQKEEFNCKPWELKASVVRGQKDGALCTWCFCCF